MANHKSAKQRVIRNKKRAVINGARKGRARTAVKKVELAVAQGDLAAAEKAFMIVQPELARGAAKGVIDKKAASRKLSRLSARIKALKKTA